MIILSSLVVPNWELGLKAKYLLVKEAVQEVQSIKGLYLKWMVLELVEWQMKISQINSQVSQTLTNGLKWSMSKRNKREAMLKAQYAKAPRLQKSRSYREVKVKLEVLDSNHQILRPLLDLKHQKVKKSCQNTVIAS